MNTSGRWWTSGKHLKWLVPLALLGVVLAAFVMILLDTPPRMRSGPFDMRYEPLVLDSGQPEHTTAGTLHFLGAWEITSPEQSFGGLSALYTSADENQLVALNDKGIAFWLPKPGVQGQARAKILPLLDYPNPQKQYALDSESLAVDPSSGKSWIGYEIFHRICRYSVGFRKVEQCKDWPEMRRWPKSSSLESLTRLPDGRFVAIAEGGHAPRGGRPMLLFEADPSDKATPPPLKMTYVQPPGYHPTDVVWVGDNMLLVLNRRVTLHEGFTATIALVKLDGAKEGAVLTGQTIAHLAPPLLADNFEGLALEKKDGQRILWIVSDDNFMFFQRTLLLKFALPEAF